MTFSPFSISLSISLRIPLPTASDRKRGRGNSAPPRADIVAGKTGLDLFNHYFPYGLAGLHDVNA